MKNNLTKNIVLTAGTAAVSQLCNVLTALLLPRLLIETLGSEYNGLISTARQFSLYLSLIDTGLYAATCYRFIRAFENDDINQVQDLFATVGDFYRKISYFAVAAVTVISLGYSKVVAGSIPSAITAYILFAYSLGTIVAYYGFFRYNIILFASGKQYYITLVCALSTVLTLVGQWFLLSINASIFLIVSVQPIAIIFRLLILKRKTLRDHSYLCNGKGEIHPELIDQKWDALVMNISDSMKTFAPIMSISLLWGAAYVSVYTVYESVLHLGSSILVMCLNGLTPTLGRELNTVTQKTCDQFHRMNNIIMALAGIVCTCFAVMIMSFISIYIGDIGDMSYSYPRLAYLLIVSVWFLMVRTGYELLIKALGYIKELRKGAVHEIMIAIIACVGAGLFLGFEFVVIGVVLSSSYRTLRMMRFCKKNIYSEYNNRIYADFVFWGVVTVAVSVVGVVFVPVVSKLSAFICWAAVVAVACVILYGLAFLLIEKRRKLMK